MVIDFKVRPGGTANACLVASQLVGLGRWSTTGCRRRQTLHGRSEATAISWREAGAAPDFGPDGLTRCKTYGALRETRERGRREARAKAMGSDRTR